MSQARKIAARTADPILDQLVSHAEGQLSLAVGDETMAVTHFETALAASRAAADLDNEFVNLLTLGLARWRSGNEPGAITCFEETLVLAEKCGESVCRAEALAGLAALTWQDQPARAAYLLDQCLRLSRELNDPATTASCLETAASLAATELRPQHAALLHSAAESLRETMETDRHRPHTCQPEPNNSERRIRLDLGERSYDEANRDGRTLTLHAAIALALREDQSPARALNPGTGTGANLTPRELQVADLVSQGLSNKAIAERLMISQRTAQGHVEHTLSKLGFTSRVQIAAWVIKQANTGQRNEHSA
ncbi:helix-turn-helix transcriptional regulator [Rhodococcus sp. JS3073]|uniref:helix-turn-helix transcriptional regulator n=1 Tax=Rhodococcus sp. JS3073 TaxID=3002901 RepID=UPI0022864A47|nr:LuxR C-terminal-related transcriptional regulator [Rhodococcus sp. JS3073]WAM19400.1 LuxR C-terminal-related transcriptional regulator [Rhodococcus sp. JS3073]